jgi:hypothetical protein
MNLDYLSFEQPIAELEAKIEELHLVGNDNELNIAEEVAKLRGKSRKLHGRLSRLLGTLIALTHLITFREFLLIGKRCMVIVTLVMIAPSLVVSLG